ncbi:MAG TPA: hypothetical protein VF129_02635 [Actinomycetota bacterium]
MATGLLAWFLWPFVANGLRFPVGPDAPVYLWWTRIAGEEGLAAVAPRPGAPALTLVLQGAFGRTVVESVAALEITLGVAVGLASASLLRGRDRGTWLLAGALAGTFAVHLAAGYVANLLQAAVFLAAAVVLAVGSGRGAIFAAAAVAAGVLVHPPFAALGSGILLLAAVMAWRRDRPSAVREGLAVLAGSALGATALLAMPTDPPRPRGATSRDAFLRRAGLDDELRGSYADRFFRRWTRYVQWVSLPLAAVGLWEPDGFVGRFLRAWAITTVVGVGLAFATGRLPPDRLVTFGFVVPILAALGLTRLGRRLRPRRTFAIAAVGGSTVLLLAGSLIAWNRQEPFLSGEEVAAAAAANAIVARLDHGTPLAFLVNTTDQTGSFLATRAANVLRAAVPPDRIRDVVVVVRPAGGDADRERAALERVTADDLRRAERRSGRPAATFVLRPFNPVDDPEDAIVLDASTPVSGDPVEPLRASSPGGIALSAGLATVLLTAAGFGWARAAVRDAAAALALAPAAGAAVLVLVAVGLERFELLLADPAGAWVVSGIAGGGGYGAWGILERLTRPRSPAEVDE